MFRTWPWTHIRKKVFKAVPTLANGDSSVLIKMHVFSNLTGKTSASHPVPYSVFRSTIEAMRGIRRDSAFALEASTTEGMPASKIHEGHHYLISTVAHYKDFLVGVLRLDLFDKKPSISIADLCSWLTHTTMVLPLPSNVKRVML